MQIAIETGPPKNTILDIAPFPNRKPKFNWLTIKNYPALVTCVKQALLQYETQNNINRIYDLVLANIKPESTKQAEIRNRGNHLPSENKQIKN